MNDQALHWLWTEISRRFGEEQAEELKDGFDVRQGTAFAVDPKLSEYQRELLQLEARLSQLESEGEPETAFMRSLRWGIEYRRQVLQESGVKLQA
jgi:hypothetical protein